MELPTLQNLLDKIEGCTFAALDATTEPSNGIRKVTTNIRVILFTNKKSSGYENMVKRRLTEAGKDPDSFVLADRPWGKRLPDSPIIENNGKYYLQCILLSEGMSKYYIGNTEVKDPSGLMLRERSSNQGLPPGSEVKVACYKLANINRIALMGELLIGDGNNIIPPSGA